MINIAAKSKKQLQAVEFEDLNFFTIKDLPPQVVYFETDLSVGTTKLLINSPITSLILSTSKLSLQYKQRNSGNEVVTSLMSLEASVETKKGRSTSRDVI